ncbi:hypothetical protein BFP72_10160 [Reichenbachiella sp. 5M10]|uniref:hypothetical protein n=1 Tax=Reichenbachiella sp. 5M10 TaxID=1889772 RepID=UPI000C150B00|nr:hypothetical protein [Reichenbachiella sp. 5M10]PIB35730.1 hypothetical protein BFP72_10160 [Reichenbachiella sp. 5M10]
MKGWRLTILLLLVILVISSFDGDREGRGMDRPIPVSLHARASFMEATAKVQANSYKSPLRWKPGVGFVRQSEDEDTVRVLSQR